MNSNPESIIPFATEMVLVMISCIPHALTNLNL